MVALWCALKQRYLAVSGLAAFLQIAGHRQNGRGTALLPLIKGELVWRRPNRATLRLMVPDLCGHLRIRAAPLDLRRKVAGRPSTGKVVVNPDQWIVMIPRTPPAYISEQTCRNNLARLSANAPAGPTRPAPPAAAALLSARPLRPLHEAHDRALPLREGVSAPDYGGRLTSSCMVGGGASKAAGSP